MSPTVRVIRGKAAYFASELYKAMKGLGTDDNTLVRIVASRCEVDMVQIKEEFQKAYKQSLAMFIAVSSSLSLSLKLSLFHNKFRSNCDFSRPVR